jgi:hypothetical protein
LKRLSIHIHYFRERALAASLKQETAGVDRVIANNFRERGLAASLKPVYGAVSLDRCHHISASVRSRKY